MILLLKNELFCLGGNWANTINKYGKRVHSSPAERAVFFHLFVHATIIRALMFSRESGAARSYHSSFQI